MTKFNSYITYKYTRNDAKIKLIEQKLVLTSNKINKVNGSIYLINFPNQLYSLFFIFSVLYFFIFVNVLEILSLIYFENIFVNKIILFNLFSSFLFQNAWLFKCMVIYKF